MLFLNLPVRACAFLLLAALSACGRQPAARAPQIVRFAADAVTVAADRGTTLRWDVRGAASVTLLPGAVSVTGASSRDVKPDVTTAYTLRAADAAGRVTEMAITVNVEQRPEPPAGYPILFVTQVPMAVDNAARLSAFANHLPGATQAPRGGALMLRYPDGSLRNLTREAGVKADIAVREPSVSWNGETALFSMVSGADAGAVWQLYEVTGLGRGERARIARVARQPAGYNNVSPLYGSDGAILFTSDRPASGLRHLYPQLDEYEATPTITGIWRLEPDTGALTILNQAVSGAFTPIIDSYGRVVFTRWDHQQRDQLAERDRNAATNGVALPFRSFNFAGEAPEAPALATRDEIFPESWAGSSSPYGEVNAFRTNFFTAWTMNEDGTGEETLNHVGQHELAFGYLTPSFRADANLSNQTVDRFHANRLPLRREGGLFHVREDPRRPGSYLATAARELDTFTTGQLVRLSGSPALNGDQMTLTAVTAAAPGDAFAGGRFRNPLPLSDGGIIASHAASTVPPEHGRALPGLRLRRLVPDRHSGLLRAGPFLTPGFHAGKVELWELDPVEVRPRQAATRAPAGLEAPERAVLQEEQVDEAALRAWLTERRLALIVTRDQTSRDRADLQQPFNLRVPGGKKTVSTMRPGGRIYDIAHFQIFQGDQVRAYPGRPGRRVLAQPLHDGVNPANAGGPAGSVKIAADGSTAAFVPAQRALTWQTTDRAGAAVVRERNWITLQPGEMRSCASCHGVNTSNQAGLAAPLNKPQALRELLAYWKKLQR